MQVTGLWQMVICIWSVLQALLGLISSTVYIIQADHAYLAVTSFLVNYSLSHIHVALSVLLCAADAPVADVLLYAAVRTCGGQSAASD